MASNSAWGFKELAGFLLLDSSMAGEHTGIGVDAGTTAATGTTGVGASTTGGVSFRGEDCVFFIVETTRTTEEEGTE